jgi:hypothetical protein
MLNPQKNGVGKHNETAQDRPTISQLRGHHETYGLEVWTVFIRICGYSE